MLAKPLPPGVVADPFSSPARASSAACSQTVEDGVVRAGPVGSAVRAAEAPQKRGAVIEDRVRVLGCVGRAHGDRHRGAVGRVAVAVTGDDPVRLRRTRGEAGGGEDHARRVPERRLLGRRRDGRRLALLVELVREVQVVAVPVRRDRHTGGARAHRTGGRGPVHAGEARTLLRPRGRRLREAGEALAALTVHVRELASDEEVLARARGGPARLALARMRYRWSSPGTS